MNRPLRLPGFTMLEIMVVVAILGILVAVASQEYGLYVAKSKRTQAISFLHAAQAAQRAHLAKTDTFGTTFAALGMESWFGGTLVSPTRLETPVYVYDLTATATTWCVSATGNIDGDAHLDIVVVGPDCPY